MRKILALVLPLAAGCVLFPLQEADCRGVDWRERGYADGYAGHPQQYWYLAEQCKQRFALEVDPTAYYDGWRDGYNEWDRLQGSMRMRR